MKKIFLTLILLVALAIFAAGAFSYQINKPADNAAQKFEILYGEGVNQISAGLIEHGLLTSPFIFETYVWIKNKEAGFIAGEYNIPEEVSISELTRILTTKERADEIVLQFIEGWTSTDIARYLLGQGIIKSEEHFTQLLTVSQWWDNYTWLQNLPADTPLEGFLFPDTYNFFSDATPADIVGKMLNNFEKKFDEEFKQEAAAQQRNLYEIVTLASILEKEVQRPEDMKTVAGIFLNRISIGMALQADSTLNYFTGGSNASLTAEELVIDSPYNTYKYRGLPPTPISNPGLAALEAALHPTESDYLYFLTSPEGEVYYGATLDEHNENRQHLK